MSVTGHEDPRPKDMAKYFQPILDGRKTFELRKADRDYQVGDFLRLKEWDPILNKYTGRQADVSVTYILDGAFSIPGMCLMSIKFKRRPFIDAAFNEGKGVYCP
jgi:hypothetical protein